MIVMIVAASAIALVSAADTVTINGVDFNVPEGYSYDADLSLAADEDYGVSPGTIGVLTNGDDQIIILVGNNTEGSTLDDINTNNLPAKTINGKDGAFNENANGMQSFAYIEDGKIFVIAAPDEATIEQVIIK